MALKLYRVIPDDIFKDFMRALTTLLNCDHVMFYPCRDCAAQYNIALGAWRVSQRRGTLDLEELWGE